MIATTGSRLKLKPMDSNTTDQEYSSADLHLSEPHFDEEATLLSARPVVPLNEVMAEGRSGKRLVFGLMIVFALVVGALGATLIFKQRGQQQGTAIAETAIPVSNPAAPEATSVTGDGGAQPDLHGSVSAMAENGGDVSTQEVSNVGVSTQARKQGSQVLPSAESNKTTETRQIEVMRRAERMEATRLKRKAEREARRNARDRKSQPSDDLLRIREIFEGAPRP
jgi:hypothetical protein